MLSNDLAHISLLKTLFEVSVCRYIQRLADGNAIRSTVTGFYRLTFGESLIVELDFMKHSCFCVLSHLDFTILVIVELRAFL